MPSPPPCLSWQPVITQPRLILLYSASGIESVCWKKSCHWRSSRTELEGSSPGPGPSRAAGPESVIGGDVTLQAGSSRAVVPATNALLTAPNCLWKGEDCAHGDPCISGRRTAMHCPYTSHSCLRGKKKSASFMESFHVYLCIYEFNALFAYLNLCLKRKKLPSEGVFMPQHLRFSCTAHSFYTTSKKKTYLLHGEFGYPPVFVWTLYVCYQNRAKPRPRALMDLLEHTELSHHLKHHVMIY